MGRIPMLDGTHAVEAVEELFSNPANGAQRISLQPGCRVLDFAPHARVMLFIHSGEIRVFQRAAEASVRLAGIFGPGEWVGASAMAGLDFPHNTVAHLASDVSILSADRVMELLEHRPDIALVMLRETASRLR